jgi:hypothetical protein
MNKILSAIGIAVTLLAAAIVLIHLSCMGYLDRA